MGSQACQKFTIEPKKERKKNIVFGNAFIAIFIRCSEYKVSRFLSFCKWRVFILHEGMKYFGYGLCLAMGWKLKGNSSGWKDFSLTYFFCTSSVGKITLYMRIWAAYSINLILAYMIEEMRLLKKRVELLYTYMREKKGEDFVNSLKAKFKSNWLFFCIKILLYRLGNLIKWGNKVTQLLYCANWRAIVKIVVFSVSNLIKTCFTLYLLASSGRIVFLRNEIAYGRKYCEGS